MYLLSEPLIGLCYWLKFLDTCLILLSELLKLALFHKTGLFCRLGSLSLLLRLFAMGRVLGAQIFDLPQQIINRWGVLCPATRLGCRVALLGLGVCTG